MSEDKQVEGATANTELLRPRLSFEEITFSDGTILTVDDGDIIVFVGPNNAGKSAALRELETWVAYARAGLVIKKAKMRQVGTTDDLRRYLDAKAQKSGDGQSSLWRHWLQHPPYASSLLR